MAPRHHAPERLPDHAHDHTPGRTPDRIPDRIPERMPDVLLMDADEGIRAALRYVLEDASSTVYEALTVREALVRMRTHPQGLVILLDFSRPRLHDRLLLQRILSGDAPTTRHAFVLLSTNPAYALGPALDLVITCGVPVVPKPFDLDDVLDAVMIATRRLPASMPVLAGVGMRAHPHGGEA